MERAAIDLTRYQSKKQRPLNEFYELCAAAANVYNKATERPVKPQRFMRDCKAHRRAYELALLDYRELEPNCTSNTDRAKLFFGCLKKRKHDSCTTCPS
jgi:hypothetical protein